MDLKVLEQNLVKISKDTFQLQVHSAETYQTAGEMLNALKELQKRIKEYFKPLKENAHKAWQAICKRETEELNKIKPPMEYLTKQMTEYNIREEKKRREEEARLRAEAEKQEEERRLKIAEELEQAGQKKEAEAIISEQISISVNVPKKVPKVDGLSMTTTWRWRVTDFSAIPQDYLKVDEVKINGIVRTLKDKTNIPGIEVYPESTMRGVRK